jgi:glutamate racemase
VRWIDPAPAIARRADHMLSERFPSHDIRDAAFDFVFTSGAAPEPRLLKTLDVLRRNILGAARPRASA